MSRELDAVVVDAGRRSARPDASADAGVVDICAPYSGFPGCGGGANFCAPIQDPSAFPVPDGGELYQYWEVCVPFCGSSPAVAACRLGVDRNGANVVVCSSPCTGRRPAGLTELGASADNELGEHFRQMAFLEAASIDAFRTFRDELSHYGAPRRLTHAAARAARDELRHTRTASALARQHGARATPPATPPRGVRSLEAIAEENAVEGCVRETFGVAVALFQAERAADPLVRAALRRIARDETRHAALAWQAARWLDARLDSAARGRVRAARDAAVRELAAASGAEPSAEVARVAGLPRASDARRMVAELARTLWA
ncbi:MAG TPA: ferritin-like domain-containing protein [Polyangiaceae bacterium]|nr:ferritin-like domain-containing protein [Polyangiaceae bacterium]